MHELTFTYEPKDYSHYTKEIICIDRISIYILKILAIPFCISVYVSIMFGGIYLYISLLVMFIIGYLVSNLLIRHILKLKQGVPQEITLKIDEATIFCYAGADKSIQTTYKWNLVKDVYNTRHLLIIFVSDLHGLIIPKRIFYSEEEIDNCWKYLQDYYNNAQSKN